MIFDIFLHKVVSPSVTDSEQTHVVCNYDALENRRVLLALATNDTLCHKRLKEVMEFFFPHYTKTS